MKKLLFFCLLFSISVITGFGQIYVSTGSNVNVRKGPGKNFSVQFQLQKGDKVYFTGKKQNGFMKVTNISSSSRTWQGWVSERYLRLEQRDQSNNANSQNIVTHNQNVSNYYDEIEVLDNEINNYIDKVNSASSTFLDAYYHGGYSRYSPPGSYFTLIEYCNALEKLVNKAKKMRHDHGDYAKDTEYNGILNKVYTIKSDSGKMLNRLY